MRSPETVIEIPKRLQAHLSTLVGLSSDEYAEPSQLPPAISKHENFQTLRKLFSQWDENKVINFILKHEPHEHCELILDALSSLLKQPQRLPNTSNEGQGNLKTIAWLVNEQGNAVHPESVLHYPDLEEDIKELLLLTPSSYVASSQLAKQIRDRHDCWQWLTANLFITKDTALTELGRLLKQVPEYQLGTFSIEEFPLDNCLEVFKKIDISFLPVWNFAQKLSKDKFKQYLLPNLLGKMDVEKLRTLLARLSSTDTQVNEHTVEIFNAWLSLAVGYDTFRQEILPHIHLLNRLKKRQTPDKLTWGNSENIERKSLLDENEEFILRSYLNNLPKNSTVLQVSGTSDDTGSYKVLKNYFDSWNHHCAWEPIGAFLILLCGGEDQCRQLAHNYLGNNHNPLSLRKKLLHNHDFVIFDIYVGNVSERTTEVHSVLGDTFRAELTSATKPINLFVNSLAPDTRKLQLISIEAQDFRRNELIKILKESARTLLQNVYSVEHTLLDEIWEDLQQSDQLNIQVAKNLLLKNAPYVLRELRMHEQNILINISLEEIKIAEREKAIAKDKGEKKNVLIINNKIDDIYQRLSALLEGTTLESEQARANLLEAVKEKIKLYGYNSQSIPFEIFQNSDDAALQWMEMSPTRQLEEKRKKFVMICNKNKILFIHAGRPINCSQHIDYPQQQYREKNYDNDLENMLTLNFSDKRESETGRFGLGFKSVYLICKRPRILSKNLGFSVEGGLIPSQLKPEEIKELQTKLKDYEMPLDATIVELSLDEGIDPQKIISDFQALANISVVFSRAISTCRFIDGECQEILTWRRTPFLGIQGVEVNTVERGNKKSVLLCLRTEGEARSALLLSIAEKGGLLSSIIPENTPCFWVTAPTQEKISVGFILNAAFKVTTGRTRLDSTGNNRKLADRIGTSLGSVLSHFFSSCESNWQAVADGLGFSTTDAYDFWNFMWQELAVSWQKADANDELRELLARILGGDRGMGYLIFHHKALPNGLYDSHRRLIDISNVRYRVMGKLAEKDCFLQVARWDSFQQYQGSLITRKRWEEAKKLLDDILGNLTITDLQLLDVLKVEIGKENPVVNINKANQLGYLISKEFLESLNDSEGEELQKFLQSVHFTTQADKPWPAKDLLLSCSDQPEENWLAGFALPNRLLHPGYKDSALNFFHACRDRPETIPVEEMVKWAKAANTDLKKQAAVRKYLGLGDRKQEFSYALKKSIAGTWMEKDEGILKIFNANSQQEKVREATEEKIPWSAVTNGNTEDEYKKKIELKKPSQDEICKRISQINIWWQKNHVTEIEKYNTCLYPIAVDKLGQGLRDRDRNAWMILFFLGVLHRMGCTKHEQHRNFINFCMNRSPNWWEIFTQPNPQKRPEKWMKVLDSYMHIQIDKAEWYAWVERFPSIYRIACYLDDYIQLFLGVEKSSYINLDRLISPRTNSLIARGGPDAPPLPLGIGVNFVLRELVRFGILSPKHNLNKHCYVPRANVRRIFTALGCEGLRKSDPDNSQIIHKFICNYNLFSPNFENTFDIPFELLAENSKKQQSAGVGDLSLSDAAVDEDA